MRALSHRLALPALLLVLAVALTTREEPGSGPTPRSAQAASRGDTPRHEPTGDPHETPAARPSADGLTALTVELQVDPRFTRGLYMGERWVSPERFTASAPLDAPVRVAIRAYGLGPGVRRRLVDVAWSSDDPLVASLSPTYGTEVELTVTDDGHTRIHLTRGELEEMLEVEAWTEGAVRLVAITR